MDYGRMSELTLRLQHRHSDGSWGSFEPKPSHHDPADHDPEREWASGTIYVCRVCDEEIHVSTVDDPGDPRA
jgi:hypothetical protein